MAEDSARLLQAVRVGHIGIFDHDHVAGTIFWSAELRSMYGWDAEEAVCLPKILAHVYPADAARVGEAVRLAHDPSGDGAFDIEHRIVDRHGTLRWLMTRSQTHFAEVDGQSRPIRTIGAVQEVTEHRQAEERLRVLESQLSRAQKMESLGRLAGGVAHDFNNLLAIILASVELGALRLADDHPARLPLADAANAARSAAGLTKQLLAISRKEAIAPRAVDLNQVLERMQRLLVHLLGANIRLETLCGRGLPVIWFDPVQLEQVILNLAVNARDAMCKGGRLTIETSVVHASAADSTTARASSVLLTVSDTGVGIADEVRAHLFEPFFTTKPPGKGTGLGLAVVYGAVQQNGGHIEVESEVGRGASFKVYLPPAKSRQLAPVAQHDGCAPR